MILFSQVLSGVLWVGLVYAVAGFDAMLADAERASVWYRTGGRVSKKREALSKTTWFGKLRKPSVMLSTVWSIVLALVANLFLFYAGFRLWILDAAHTNIYGMLGIILILVDVLLVALYGPMFYYAKSVVLGFINVLLEFIVVVVAAIMVAVFTWYEGVTASVMPFISLCVVAAYLLYELVYHGALYAKQPSEEYAQL